MSAVCKIDRPLLLLYVKDSLTSQFKLRLFDLAVAQFGDIGDLFARMIGDLRLDTYRWDNFELTFFFTAKAILRVTFCCSCCCDSHQEVFSSIQESTTR